MSEVRVSIRKNKSVFQALVKSPRGAVGDFLTSHTTLVEREARRLAPKQKGTLSKAHRVTPAKKGTRGKLTAALSNDADYAVFVHQGTGEYVGNSVIRPDDAEAMVFESGKFGGRWAAAYVRGQAPQPWMIHAYNAAARLDPRTDVVITSSVPVAQRPTSPPVAYRLDTAGGSFGSRRRRQRRARGRRR